MSEEKSLIVRQELTPATWQMIKDIAPAMQASRLFGVKNPEEAMAIMLKGYELGFSLTASFEFVNVINGRPGLSPRGMLALIQQSPNFAGMKIEDKKDDKGNPQSCQVTMKRVNGFEYATEYSMDNAEQASLIKKDSGWDKYPANMLRWRTIGYCADVVFPDVIGGMKRADELGASITPDGNVWKPESIIENTPPVTIEQEIKPAEPMLPDYGYTLQTLLEAVSDENILSVFDGSLPVTTTEVNLAVHRLIEKGILENDKSEQD